jgi:thiamine-monophosphate kinase
MERDLVRWICSRLPANRRLIVGAGDDAAILRLTENANVVATTDMLMDGVDFELERHEPEQIGRKALGINLSDLAAMAAMPIGALVSVALPYSGGEQIAKRLIDGMLSLSQEFDCPIAGGDTNSWEGPLVISITALGEVPPERRWLRSGAQPGDAIVVTGEFGGSILGRQFHFIPRVREALWLAENAIVHAAMDVSDGLSLDLSRICEASGCGAVVDLDKVPVAAAAEQLAQEKPNGTTVLDHALGDGEDFELILAVPLDEAKDIVAQQPLQTRLTQIGQFVAGSGLFCRGKDGQREPLPPRGYEHRLD